MTSSPGAEGGPDPSDAGTDTGPALDSPLARDLLAEAVELAVAVARRDATDREAPAPPGALRPVLQFARLPDRARRTVVDVLDTDDVFRARVGADPRTTDLDSASSLFLTRPDGWRRELELMLEALSEESAEAEVAEREQSAQRRLAQVEATVERIRAERDAARERLDGADERLGEQRRRVSDLETEVRRLRSELDASEAERTRAVRQLKSTEATAAERLEELRSEQRRVAELSDDLEAALGDASPPAASPGGDPGSGGTANAAGSVVARRLAAAAGGVAGAAAAAEALAASLGEVARSLTDADADADAPSPSGSREATPGEGVRGPRGSEPAERSRVGARRRVPQRLRHGLRQDTPEGLRQLLDIPGALAVVDGYNVSMEGWPALDRGSQRDSLVGALGSLQSRVRASLHVVFDGEDDGRRPAVGAPLPVRVHFSPAEVEADDVILSMVSGTPGATPVVVVSSDRRVAREARAGGANAVGSTTLLELLRR